MTPKLTIHPETVCLCGQPYSEHTPTLHYCPEQPKGLDVFTPDPNAIAPGRNIDSLTFAQLAGRRLLDDDEVGIGYPMLNAVEGWASNSGRWVPGVSGSLNSATYGTRLSREQLAQARGLSEPAFSPGGLEALANSYKPAPADELCRALDYLAAHSNFSAHNAADLLAEGGFPIAFNGEHFVRPNLSGSVQASTHGNSPGHPDKATTTEQNSAANERVNQVAGVAPGPLNPSPDGPDCNPSNPKPEEVKTCENQNASAAMSSETSPCAPSTEQPLASNAAAPPSDPAEPAVERLVFAPFDGEDSEEKPSTPTPEELHPETAKCVHMFFAAVRLKLIAAQQKYGFTDGWKRDDWEKECRRDLMRHIAKGDPRDVAAYCAFMWHHKWSTATPEPAGSPTPEERARDAAREWYPGGGMVYANLAEVILRALNAQTADLEAERERLMTQLEGVVVSHANMNIQRDDAITERDALRAEVERLTDELEIERTNHAHTRVQNNALKAEREELLAGDRLWGRLEREREDALAKVVALEVEVTRLKSALRNVADCGDSTEHKIARAALDVENTRLRSDAAKAVANWQAAAKDLALTLI